MGRKRTKDFDLRPGERRINGRVYYQPTTPAGRDERRRLAYELPEGSLVYFVREKSGPVKIGYTTSKKTLALRLTALRTHCARGLALIGAVPGTREDEARAHEALHLWKRAGEWFGPSRAVTAYIRQALLSRRVPGIE